MTDVVARIDPEYDQLVDAIAAKLTPAERARLVQLMHERKAVAKGRAKRPLSLRQFVDRLSGGKFKWYQYAVVLASVLQRVANGTLKRVLIFAPPRHGKSELVSRYFPAYFLYRHQEQWIALVSYAAELALTLSKAARFNYFAYHDRQEVGAVKHWETGHGGGLWATGMGGPALGKGFNCGIIDDPLKNAEEASSEKIRSAHKEWYQSVFSTRAEPDAAIVVIQQRWHEDDLSGWLLDQEWRENEAADDAIPEHWHIVDFEAIRSSPEEIAADVKLSDRPTLYPPTCTVEPDWRKPGEALNEERFSRERLLRTKRRVGVYYWNALYRQRPRPREGLLFAIDKLAIVGDQDIPWQRLRLVRFWDKAGSDKKQNESANYTVGALLGIDDTSGLVYILDIQRGQWSPGDRDLEIEKTIRADVKKYAQSDNPDRYIVWGEQEPGSAGIDSSRAFRRLVQQYTPKVYTERATGSKEDRADGLASATGQNEVRMLRAAWNGTLRRELADFPNGANDDIVDACSGAYNKLVRKRIAPDEIAPSVSRRYA